MKLKGFYIIPDVSKVIFTVPKVTLDCFLFTYRDSSSSSIHTDKDSPSTASIVSAGSIQTASDLSSKTSSTIRTASDMSEHPSNTIHTATEVTSHSQQNSITEEVNSTKGSLSSMPEEMIVGCGFC